MSRLDREGRCYELAALHMIANGRDDPSMRVCHGWPILRGEAEHAGKRYGHAWVERTTITQFPAHDENGNFLGWDHLVEKPTVECMDTVTETWWPRPLYFNGGQIEDHHVTRYTHRETLEKVITEETYGAWSESPYATTAPFRNAEPDETTYPECAP